MIKNYKNFLCSLKFFRNQAGAVLIEFSIVLPVLVIAFLYVIELTRTMLVMQKMEKTLILVNNIATQYIPPGVNPPNSSFSSIGYNSTSTPLSGVMSQVPTLMQPYDKPSSSYVFILSDVSTNAAGVSKINWQYCGGGVMPPASKIGSVGQQASNLPAGFTPLGANEEFVVGEAYYKYTPLLPHTIPSFTYYKTTVFEPRYGSLSGFQSSCR